MPNGHSDGIASERSPVNGPDLPDGPERSLDNIDVPYSSNGKFTLNLDCDQLLKPDTNRPGIYTSKSAEEVVEHLQLSTLLPVPILNQIKIKMFHTCGPIEFDEGSCLRALWSIGDWFVEQFQEIGKSARYEKSDRGREEDWADPDARLLVVLD
ncbi:unnamed protein product [Alternaria alternata]